MGTRLRQFAPVGVVLVLTAVGFFLARAHGESDARHESSHRAEIAAIRVRDHVAQAGALADGLRRFLVGEDSSDVTTERFAELGASWLGPVGVPAAAWVERVPGSERTRYEQRIGRRIVVADSSGALIPAGVRSTYLPATLVTGSPPLSAPGVDLGGSSGISAAVARPQTAYRASATRLVRLSDGTAGLFLVQSAQRLILGTVEPGFVVLFLPASWLVSGTAGAVGSNPREQITVGGGSAGDLGDAATAVSTFAEAGQPFAVGVPQGKVTGAAAVQPWLIGAAGLLLAVLVGALRMIGARRARARAEVDRLFTLSSDLIVVAGFDGYFKRVNPAFTTQLGYTEEEALSRPYIEFVHPDDRALTEVKSSSLREGELTVAFENRYVCKDGSIRWIEWTSTPVVEERLIYGVARDVTERRRAEAGLREAEGRNRALAEEQASLRRVATLVAQRTPPEELFAAVTEEVGQLLPVTSAAMGRYEADGTFTTVAAWSNSSVAFAVGKRWLPEGKNVTTMVFETGRPARMDDFGDASGPVGVVAREAGYRSAVGTPITVEGRLWGVMTAASYLEEPLPADTEARLASFTELVATAIANAESRSQLAASRARIVAASDDTRRRIERDLHDGTQQRLVSLSLELRLAESIVSTDIEEARRTLGRVAGELVVVIDELREISRGIHPAILTEGGLGPALRTLTRRSVVPIQLGDVVDERLPTPVEVAAYYVVSEALANASKHANASRVDIEATVLDGSLSLSIRDNGCGGANPAAGSGLIGLRDRVEALGGSIQITSPSGQGTHVAVRLPLELDFTPDESTDPRPARISASS